MKKTGRKLKVSREALFVLEQRDFGIARVGALAPAPT